MSDLFFFAAVVGRPTNPCKQGINFVGFYVTRCLEVSLLPLGMKLMNSRGQLFHSISLY